MRIKRIGGNAVPPPAAIPGPRAIVIGSGVAGILAGIRLLERGIQVTILEKAATLGGTWRDNRYPGVACDVAAHLYVYSFEPNPAWKSRYATGPDLWRYFAGVAEKYGVSRHIRYDSEVVAAAWDGHYWTVQTADGASFRADIVIGATGRLHHPVIADIPGLASFAGRSFHTARWDQTVDLTDKRVGIIGTGSTATQIVTALAGKVRRLDLFQRTPQWVFPMPNTPVPWLRRLLFHISPSYGRRYYRQLEAQTEARGAAATGDKAARAARDRMCHDALATVRDPVLRAKLTPDYEVGCKRLVISGTFYEAVQRPGVRVISDNIERVEPAGVQTRDGALHELDVLVIATGFDAHAYMRPMQMTGAAGVSLDMVWQDRPITYRSVAIPQMPNFFLINGPYSPGGSASVTSIIETHVGFVMKLVDRVVAEAVAIAPRAEASNAWLDGVRERAARSVWGTGGCVSWLLDKSGVPALDAITLSELKAQMAEPIYADFEIDPLPIRSAPDAAA